MVSKTKWKSVHGKQFKILTPTQMLPILKITILQLKASKTSKSLLNEICQIMYSLYQAKQITKKVYNNIMDSAKLKNRMDNIFTNSKT